MSIPFTYLVGWTNHNTWYYGVRYAKNCHPNDLWTKYFTSSKYVDNFRKKYGEPDVVEVRKTFSSIQKAKLWEDIVIRRMKCVQLNEWLNKGNGGKEFMNTAPNAGSFSKDKEPWNKGKIGAQIAWNKDKTDVQTFTKERNRKLANSLKRLYEIEYPDGSFGTISGLKDYCQNNDWSYSWVCNIVGGTGGSKTPYYKGHKITRIDIRPSGYR